MLPVLLLHSYACNCKLLNRPLLSLVVLLLSNINMNMSCEDVYSKVVDFEVIFWCCYEVML